MLAERNGLLHDLPCAQKPTMGHTVLYEQRKRNVVPLTLMDFYRIHSGVVQCKFKFIAFVG